MLHFLYESEQRENAKFRMNTIISLAYIKCSRVSVLEPRQNNLSNLEAYSELCQTFKMEWFAKNSRLVKVFVKHSTLDVRQSSKYTSVIYY